MWLLAAIYIFGLCYSKIFCQAGAGGEEARPDLQPGDGRASDVPLHQEQVARLVLVLVIVVVLVVLMEMLVVLMEMVVAS